MAETLPPSVGLRCLSCGGPNCGTRDTRPVADGRAIRRRRVCPRCGHRWTTYEQSDDDIGERERALKQAFRKIEEMATHLRDLLNRTPQAVPFEADPWAKP